MRVLIGCEPKVNCWVAIPDYPFISKSLTSYLIQDAYIGIELLIAKECSHGVILSEKIRDKTPASELVDLLETWTLLNAGVEIIRSAISRAINESYDKGRADKASEFRDLLDLS